MTSIRESVSECRVDNDSINSVGLTTRLDLSDSRMMEVLVSLEESEDGRTAKDTIVETSLLLAWTICEKMMST